MKIADLDQNFGARDWDLLNSINPFDRSITRILVIDSNHVLIENSHGESYYQIDRQANSVSACEEVPPEIENITRQRREFESMLRSLQEHGTEGPIGFTDGKIGPDGNYYYMQVNRKGTYSATLEIHRVQKFN